MKNVIKTISIIFIILISNTSCSDEYFDVNTPSDAVDISNLNMKDLLAPVIHSTIYAQYYTETSFGNYSQYFGSYGSGAVGKTRNNATWNSIYLNALPNLKVIQDKALESNSTHYLGISKVLTAINIGLSTDIWENVPYSEATSGVNNTHPKFDTQQEIYAEIFILLDGAITDLNTTDNSLFKPGNDDLIYKGDIDKWIKAAHTLKARYQLHLVNKGVISPSEVLTTLANGFTSNNEDFQMNFPENKINPWYSTEVLSRSTGNFYRAPNDQLISLMNGDIYPFLDGQISEDPRLQEIYAKESSDSTDPWRGFMNGGEGESSDGEDANTYYKDGGFFTSANSPLILITYAEAMFIKAEAAFLVNGGTETSTGSNSDAYNAYMTGIQANMDKIGANSIDYISDSAVNVGESALMLNHIMKEKYIANILNVETYNDFRRYKFSPNVFKGLAIRLEQDTDAEYYGEWFERSIYPTDEKNSNEAVVLLNEKEPTVPVWWAE